MYVPKVNVRKMLGPRHICTPSARKVYVPRVNVRKVARLLSEYTFFREPDAGEGKLIIFRIRSFYLLRVP